MEINTIIIICSNVATVFASVAVNRTDISWLKKSIDELKKSVIRLEGRKC